VLVDLTKASYGEFVDFVFDHPTPASPWEPEWFHDPELEVFYDARVQAAHLARLFREPEPIAKRFTCEQLEQGFWLILGPAGLDSGFLQGLLWDDELEWELRAALIDAMVDLFADFFAKEPLETTCFLWWDLLAWDYGPGGRDPARDADDARVQAAMFEALCRILALDSESCRKAALHGLGHLRHPDGPRTIEQWLETCGNADPALRDYARECASGTML